MRFIVDHDFHIHSTISPCCHDEKQTPQAILDYGIKNGYRKICLTNHLWDEAVESEAQWHEEQRFSCLCSALPLPQAEGIEFLFGAEADMDYNFVLGVGEKALEKLDFITVPTTHMHLAGNTVREKIQTPEEAVPLWFQRLYKLLEKDLPWHKIGIAHLTCGHILKGKTAEVVRLLPENELYNVFSLCAQKGVGIELNVKTLAMSEEEKAIIMKPYFIAKDCGCKFYLGSDAHRVDALLDAKENFENVVTLLGLEEKDKFPFVKRV